jgi:small subunit ribosomal protein S6
MDSLSQYESMFILHPNLGKEDTDKLVDRFQALLTGQAAEIIKLERLGKRKLAYEVNGQEEGSYCLLQFRSKASAVEELERQFRFSDQVIKFQTLKAVKQRVIKLKKPKPAPAAAPAQA